MQPQRQLLAWAEIKLKRAPFRDATAIGIIARGVIAAVCVYHDLRWPNIEASIASEGPYWASRGACEALVHYPFVQLDCKRITAVTDAANLPARAFLERFGFIEEGYHVDARPDGDAVTYGMLRRECRWLESVNGKERTVSTSAA